MTNELVKPKSRKKRRPWPPKHLQKLSAAAHQRKLWKQSTGPKTKAGRTKTAKNAYKHGFRSRDMHEIRRLLRAYKTYAEAAVFKAFNGG